MTTKTYDFADPSEFTFDSDLIDFTALQKPRLKLQNNPGQDFIEDFADDTDFVYDSDLAEFVAGKLQQKDQRPGSTFGANYSLGINANYSDGSPTGTAYNGAGITAGKLDLSGSVNKYIDYYADLNADMQQVGCFRFKWTPKYSGAGSFQYMITIVEGVGLPNNRIRLYHQSTLLFLSISDLTGASIVSSAESFSPVADQEYEIELNWDLTTGETRLFVDGLQLGTTHTGTGTRDSNIGLIRLGKDLNGNGNADFLIDDLIFFDSVQHTSNYTPGYNVVDYIYATNTVTLPEMHYTGAGTLITFDSFATVESGTPRYTLQIGRSGNYLYWDGAAWSVSDGTYAQANDATTFNANLVSLNIEGEIYGQFKIHFTGSNTQSWIDTLTASLTAQIYPITNPSISFNEGISIDSFSSFSETATKTGSDEIKYILSKDSVQYYWDGAAWSVSDGTYAQSNTAAEIETNKASFTASGIDLDIEMFLHSNDGTTTPLMTALVIIYDLYGGAATTLSKCTVWGYVYDGEGNPVTSGSVRGVLSDYAHYSEILLKSESYVTSDVRSSGYWELDLINTVTLSPSEKWKIEFLDDSSNVFYTVEVSVPDQDSAELGDLI